MTCPLSINLPQVTFPFISHLILYCFILEHSALAIMDQHKNIVTQGGTHGLCFSNVNNWHEMCRSNNEWGKYRWVGPFSDRALLKWLMCLRDYFSVRGTRWHFTRRRSNGSAVKYQFCTLFSCNSTAEKCCLVLLVTSERKLQPWRDGIWVILKVCNMWNEKIRKRGIYLVKTFFVVNSNSWSSRVLCV